MEISVIPFYLIAIIVGCVFFERAAAEPVWNQASRAEGAVLRLRSATVTQPSLDTVIPVELKKPYPSPLYQEVRPGSVVDSVEVSVIRLLEPMSLSKKAISELSQITSTSKFKSDIVDNTSGLSSGKFLLIPDSKESDLAWVIECFDRVVRVRLAVAAGPGIWQFATDGKCTGFVPCELMEAILKQHPVK